MRVIGYCLRVNIRASYFAVSIFGLYPEEMRMALKQKGNKYVCRLTSNRIQLAQIWFALEWLAWRLVGKGSNECILCNSFQVAYVVSPDVVATSNGKPRRAREGF